ncbi:MAG: hypothetical protein K2Q10_01640, partial [Rhodospirillales bacterium]|nr:hypothetical protein [Rhodospirillales bacterium]
ADAAESVDRDANCHAFPPKKVGCGEPAAREVCIPGPEIGQPFGIDVANNPVGKAPPTQTGKQAFPLRVFPRKGLGQGFWLTRMLVIAQKVN